MKTETTVGKQLKWVMQEHNVTLEIAMTPERV